MRIVVTGLFLFVTFAVAAQQGALKPEKNPFHEAYHDSLKKMDYNYTLPFLGKKSEVGTFGTRSQFLLNLNYSFLGLRKRK